MAVRKAGQKPEWQKQIAKERIGILFSEAEKMSSAGRIEFANRYVELARKIGMRYNVKLGKENKAMFCRNCKSYIGPEKLLDSEKEGKSKPKRVKCFNCDKIIHIPQKKAN